MPGFFCYDDVDLHVDGFPSVYVFSYARCDNIPIVTHFFDGVQPFEVSTQHHQHHHSCDIPSRCNTLYTNQYHSMKRGSRDDLPNYHALRLGMMIFKNGEAAHRGPGFLMTILNVTQLLNNASFVLKHQFDAMLVCEHSLVKHQLGSLKSKLGKNPQLHLSDLDGELVHHTGGTCAIRRGKKFVDVVKPRQKQLGLQADNGRVRMYTFEVCPNAFLLCYQIHGYTNGDICDNSAARTDDIM